MILNKNFITKLPPIICMLGLIPTLRAHFLGEIKAFFRLKKVTFLYFKTMMHLQGKFRNKKYFTFKIIQI